MDKYWKQEVLDFIPAWTKAIKMAEEAKKKNPKGDDKPVLDEFSPEYPARLAAAGYKFVDMTKSDGKEEEVEEEMEAIEDQENEDPQEHAEDEEHLHDDEVNAHEFDRYDFE